MNVSAESMVNDFLFGSGVLISNVTTTGNSLQRGVFSGGGAVGMDAGVVLSTEYVGTIVGENDPFFTGAAWDEDLFTLANIVPDLIGQSFSVSSVNDISALEFDFIPYGDSLAFNYVFGSDEYLEWVNTSFNDVFGFFISGPGITGPYSSPDGFPDGSKNIAFVPDLSYELPITVSSVNDQINTEYYIDNFANDSIFLDGYTTVLTAFANNLQIGETYHIRLAIADGSDNALGSVVMLEAGSFSSYETVEVGAVGDFNSDGVLDMNDLLALLADFTCTGSCTADLTGDNVVNIQDILFFLSLFGG